MGRDAPAGAAIALRLAAAQDPRWHAAWAVDLLLDMDDPADAKQTVAGIRDARHLADAQASVVYWRLKQRDLRGAAESAALIAKEEPESVTVFRLKW